MGAKESKTVSEPKVIGIVSGFFDPLGQQHILYFQSATEHCDHLVIGVNSDECAKLKKGQDAFQSFEERVVICSALKLKIPYDVVGFEDLDGSASQLIHDVFKKYKTVIEKKEVVIKFLNGGDRRPTGDPIPEVTFVEENIPEGVVEFVYGVGGEHKAGSSSTNLRKWVNNTMERYGVDFRLEKKY